MVGSIPWRLLQQAKGNGRVGRSAPAGPSEMTAMEPSEEAAASMSPSSCGAHATLLTLASSSVGGLVKIGCHTFSAVSFQMITCRRQ